VIPGWGSSYAARCPKMEEKKNTKKKTRERERKKQGNAETISHHIHTKSIYLCID